MRKQIITVKETKKAEKVLARLDENVREHLEITNKITAEFENKMNWQIAEGFEHRLWGMLAMLETLEMITEEENELLGRYFIDRVIKIKREMDVA